MIIKKIKKKSGKHLKIIIKKNQKNQSKKKVGDIGSPTHPHSHVLSIKTWEVGRFF